MSHEGRHGRGRKHREDFDHHDRRRDVYDTPEQKLKLAILKFGEADAEQELPRLAAEIREFDPPNVPVYSEALRLGVVEQPYKIPYYAALLRSLYEPSPPTPEEDGSMSNESPSLGRQILDDLWKGFQAYLDKLAWREVRLCVHFFAHLTVAKVISPQSMLGLLQSFTAVLDEFGVSHGRAKRAAFCAAEGLMRAGQVLKDYSAASVIEMITGIQTYDESTSNAKSLVQPMVFFYRDSPADHIYLKCAVAALKTLDSSDFSEIPSIYPQPYIDAAALTVAQFDLPSVLVPPEVIELDNLATDAGEDALVKKEEWPDLYIRLFENSVTPDPTSPAGYAVRTDLLDIVDIFEVNRKECARLLVEYPKWTIEGTFKPKPGPHDSSERVPIPGRDWELESSVIETILGIQYLLPETRGKPIYYITLITELCKLSPQTVGPAVGKSIRRLYSYLADGLDVEVARRFAEWFSVHMSNFGFQWVWKEWIPDLALTAQHPKRVFVRRALEFEIRLSYFDRVLKTLPEPFQDPSALAMPDQAPGPEYDYDDPATPHHDAAQSVLNQLRGRAKPEDVMSLLESIKNTITETSEGDVNVDSIIRSIAVQSLLHIGSRSFSHFLNAIERYINLLRNLATGGITAGFGGPPSAEAKADILTVAATFWRRNRQMVGIVFDKLMQYQIVEPKDIVKWVFDRRGEDGIEWDLLKGAIDKANGRVVVARKRVAALRKEEDDTRARVKASGGEDVATAMEVENDTKQEEAPAVDSPVLVTALKAFASLTREQKSTLSSVLDGFVESLHAPSSDRPSPAAGEVITEKAWGSRANWGDDEWKSWTTWALYKHFCRAYSPFLKELRDDAFHRILRED
ncbi:hypothetical protein EW146_g6881 [Bondarzewia mesenterica]|uniref:MIF4G domain-containing protein n=1 Tax=Bondarzewia mesenterica TaxID=1095465 RepID=A0A4S4LMB4_9AGAM|nr:hypothetical protein EW146_g6881 [Bondarzewia mesenterica]